MQPPSETTGCVTSPSETDSEKSYHRFTTFPPEIRIKIWEAALESRIVRWTRTPDGNVFTGPSKSLPLLAVCKESRETAFLFAGYRLLAGSSKAYFSPVLDYLWLDPKWGGLDKLEPVNLLASLREQFGDLRNVMVHPNWSSHRMAPTVSLASIPSIQRILVAADEKSIGIRSSIMLDTMQDLKYYYYRCQREKPGIEIPYIAVGCLGWTGAERRSLTHSSEDKRQLLAVFENYAEMKAHLALMREEEWKFTQQQRLKSKFPFKLRQIPNKDVGGPSTGTEDAEPPSVQDDVK